MGKSEKDIVNAFNIYKAIIEANSPISLLSMLADLIDAVPDECIVPNAKNDYGTTDDDGTPQNYLYFFKLNHYWEENK